MTATLALVDLYEQVVTRFEQECSPATHHFGWRASSEQKPGSTVVWMPGDPNGALGEVGAASKPGRNPRPLATLRELFTVEITAVDLTLADELAQYTAARLLYDAWLRAVYLAARGRFVVVSAKWLKDKVQRSHGATIQVVVALEAMVPDAPHAVAPTDAVASGNAHLLDVTTPVSVPEES